MRLFLKIRQQHKQIAFTRINFKAVDSSTDELISFISKFLRLPSNQFILRLDNKGKTWIRIIEGWDLSHYHLQSGIKIDIQLINMEEENVKTDESSPTSNFVLFPKQTEVIEEEPEEMEKQETELEQLVIKRHQQLLELIVKNDYNSFIKMFKEGHKKIGECQNLHFKEEIKGILSHLGIKGKAAIHYVAENNSIQFLQFLISLSVDINIKSSNSWLPIEIAIQQGNIQIATKLLEQPTLDLNICTAQGSPLILAIKKNKMGLIQKMLQKGVKLDLKNKEGQTAFDLVPKQNSKLLNLLKSEEKRQSLIITSEDTSCFHSLICLYRGQVTRIRTPPRVNSLYYIVLNPYEKALMLYKKREDYPKNVKEVIPLQQIKKVKKLSKEDKSWYMKEGMFYFCVEQKSKINFGCNFAQTVDKWQDAFSQCQKYVKAYGKTIQGFAQNQQVISDRIQLKEEKQKHKQTLMQTLSFISLKQKSSPKSPASSPSKETKESSSITDNSDHSEQKKEQIEEIKQENSQPYKYKDFKFENVLGEGSFGTVYLCKHENGNRYALKCFKKKKLVVHKQIKFIIAELNILKQIDHPFIVNLHFTFQTPSNVYLGLDYCSGGDLSSHLMREVNFPQNQCRIYGAQILSALIYLHNKKIIYRDLKPQNIMLDADGHIKLVDFGLSKQVETRSNNFQAKSFCGSPAYISPQMLQKKGVGKESDFYCLGAVIYEMLIGEPPYFSDDIETLYFNIEHGKLAFPKGVSMKARSLLCGLLERNPSKRLGYKDVNDIKKHDFFHDIDWSKLQRKQIEAPKREGEDSIQSSEEELIKFIHQDEDYNEKNKRINRFINFSFSKKS